MSVYIDYVCLEAVTLELADIDTPLGQSFFQQRMLQKRIKQIRNDYQLIENLREKRIEMIDG